MPDYFQHQHAQRKGDDNVVPVSALYDQVKPGAGGVEHSNGTIQLATGIQMQGMPAPVVPEPKLTREEQGLRTCASEGCSAFPMKKLDHCAGHARSLGLVENWTTTKKSTSK